MTLLSIIVPTFNRASNLERCIKSIPKDLEEILEIIVVDDCSTDDTKNTLDRLQNEKIKLKYITFKKNKGVSYARNYGLKITSACYVTFLDSDDKLIGKNITQLLKLLDNSNADFVVANFHTTPSKKYVEDYTQFDSLNNLKKIDVFNLVEKYLDNPRGQSIMTYCWAKVFRKEFLDRNKINFNEGWRIYEDLDFVSKVLVSNPISYSYKEPIYLHTLSRSGLSQQISDHPRNYLAVIKRYGEFINNPGKTNIAIKKAILKIIFEESNKNNIKSLFKLTSEFHNEIKKLSTEIPSNKIIKKFINYRFNRFPLIFVILVYLFIK